MAELEARFQRRLNTYIQMAEQYIRFSHDNPVSMTKARNALNAARRASLTQQMEDFWIATERALEWSSTTDSDSDIE